MTLFRPLFMQAAEGDAAFEYSANEYRSFWGVLFNTEGVANTNGANLFTTNDLKVSQRSAGANMSVDILGGLAVIQGDDVSFQGFYVVFSSATENVTVPAPPVSGTRIHRVVARVRDKLHDGTQTTYDWVLEVVEDTDGSGPPALPDSAISLATVTVASTDSSVLDSAITDTRESAVMGSGMTAGRYVSSTSGRPANPRESEIIYRTDKAVYEFWDGSFWYEIPRRDGGGSAWSTYTPALTATTSNPSMGTGSLVEGAWMRVGSLVTVRANLKAGSGATAGSGTYRISLPVTAKTLTTGSHRGSAEVYDFSADNTTDGIVRVWSGTGWDKAELVINDELWTSSNPFGLGSSDQLGFTITYEASA